MPQPHNYIFYVLVNFLRSDISGNIDIIVYSKSGGEVIGAQITLSHIEAVFLLLTNKS